MKGWIVVLAGSLALLGLPAHADHRHYWRYPASYFSFSYGYPYYGYPYYGYRGFYPSYSFGFGLAPRYRPPRREKRETVRAQRLYVYPAGGQTEAQLAEDRYQCHVWSADNTGYDPTLGAGTAAEADDYSRAFTACMEGRNYVVK